MGMAIFRGEKLKSPIVVARSGKHNFREQVTPNADPTRTASNTHIGPQNVAQFLAAFRSLLPDKIRKNAVYCLEFVATGSPESINTKTRTQQDAYFRDALTWFKETFGAKNVFAASIHRDEKTPHIAIFIVPLDPDTGRLNARRWMGGAKALSMMQTDFWEKVGKKHGLDRGVLKSKAKHTEIRHWYAQQQGAEKLATARATITVDELQPRKLQGKSLSDKVFGAKEPVETIALRLTNRFKPVYLKAQELEREKAALQAELERQRQHVIRLEAKNRSLSEALLAKTLELAQWIGDLAASQLEQLRLIIDKFRVSNAAELTKQVARDARKNHMSQWIDKKKHGPDKPDRGPGRGGMKM